MIYTTPFFSIYFGNASDQLYQEKYHRLHTGSSKLVTLDSYVNVCKQLNISHLTFCHQTHSTKGYTATLDAMRLVNPLPFTLFGDFLITNEPIALGVMTADCLPIVMHDRKTHAVGIVHAGWRGTLAGVTLQAIIRMEETFGTKRQDIEFIFGPAAGSCCYQVTHEFMDYLSAYSWRDDVLCKRNETLFFDIVRCNQKLLHDYGIPDEVILTTFNQCTICNIEYCSHRRDSTKAGRQMTIVAPNMYQDQK